MADNPVEPVSFIDVEEWRKKTAEVRAAIDAYNKERVAVFYGQSVGPPLGVPSGLHQDVVAAVKKAAIKRESH